MTDAILRQPEGDLPSSITHKLQQVLDRRRRVILLRGILALVSVTVGSILAAMAIDAAFTILSPVVHWALLLTVIALIGGTGYWLLVRPLIRPMNLARIAQMVETDHPEFEERLSSAVELMGSHDRSEFLGSAQLIARLAEEASVQAEVVDPQSTFSIRSIRPYIIAACATLSVLAGIWLIWPKQTGQLMARIGSPSGSVGSLGSEQLTVRPGDKVAVANETFNVDVLSERSIDSAQLFRSDSQELVPMMRAANEDGKEHFTIPLTCADSDLEYRVIVNGSVHTDLYTVKVSPRPVIQNLSMEYTPDPYTGLPVKFEENAKGEIEATPGTKVATTAIFNKPIESVDLLVNGSPQSVAVSSDGKSATWTIPVGNGDGQWTVQAVDKYGFKSELVSHRIKLQPDLPPTVILTQPTEKELHASPTDIISFDYKFHDDYGISQVALVLNIKDHGGMEMPVAGGKLVRTAEARAVLNLKTVAPGAREIRVRVRVRDSLPPYLGGPQEGLSEERIVHVDQAEGTTPYDIRRIENRAAKVEASLRECIALLTQVREWMKQAAPVIQADPVQLGAQSQQFLTLSRTNGTKTDVILQRIIDEEVAPDFMNTADEVVAVREGPVMLMNGTIDDIRLTDKKDDQVSQVPEVGKQADLAIAELQKIIENLKKEKEKAEEASELASEILETAQTQEAIAEIAREAEWTPEAINQLYNNILKTQVGLAAKGKQMAARVAATKTNPSGQQHNEAATAAQAAADKLGKIDDLKGKDVAEVIKEMEKAEKNFDETAKGIDKAPASPDKDSLKEWNENLRDVQKNVKDQLDAVSKGDPEKALKIAQEGLAKQAEKLAKEAAERAKEAAQQAAAQPQSPQGKPPGAGKVPNLKATANALDEAEKNAKAAAMAMAPSKAPGKTSPMKVVDGPQAPSEGGGKSPEKGGQGTKGGGSNTGAGNSKSPSPPNNNKNNTIGKGKNLGKAYIDKDSDLTQNGPPVKGAGSGVVLMEGAEEALRKAGQLESNPESKGFGGLSGGPSDEDTPPGPEHNIDMPGQDQPDNGKEGKPGEGKPGQGKPGSKPGKGGGRGMAGGKPGEAEFGASSSDWLKLPSDLREDILQSADADVPEEYRDLVNRYFQNLSRGAATNEKK